MALTLLQLVQQASGEMGLLVPQNVAANTSADVTQMLYLSNAVGNELARQYTWNALNREYRFSTTVATSSGVSVANNNTITGLDPAVVAQLNSDWMITGQGINQDTYVVTASGTQVTLSQTAKSSGTFTFTFGQTKYDMPADYDRQIDRTHYDKSKRWEMLGPETPQQWQHLKSSYIATGPRIRYRLMGGQFQIWPILGTSEYLGFEYISTGWVDSATGTPQASFLADTDTSVFPDRLMVLGLKRKYFEIKGFDSTAFERDYQEQLNIAKANDSGSQTLQMSPQNASVLIGFENIVDSGYGNIM